MATNFGILQHRNLTSAAPVNMMDAILGGAEKTGAIQNQALLGKQTEATTAATLLANQAEQEKLKYLPGELALKAKNAPELAQLGIQKQRADIQSTLSDADVNRMRVQEAQYKAKSSLYLDAANTAAGIKTLRPEDRPYAWQAQKQKLAELGFDTRQMPATYGPHADQWIDAFEVESGAKAQEAKDAQAILLKQMDVQGAALKGQAKIQAAQQAEITKPEAEANTKFKTDVVTKAETATNKLTTFNELQAAGDKAYHGFLAQGGNWNSPEGQEFNKYLNTYLVNEISGMKNTGRVSIYLAKLVKASKLGGWQKPETYKHILTGYQTEAKRNQQELAFTNYLWANGIQDRGHIEDLWNKYDAEYPILKIKENKFLPENVGKWPEFLAKEKPRGLDQSALSQFSQNKNSQQKPPVPKDFKFPPMGQPAAPQTSPMQGSPYMQPNPYDNIGAR